MKEKRHVIVPSGCNENVLYIKHLKTIYDFIITIIVLLRIKYVSDEKQALF